MMSPCNHGACWVVIIARPTAAHAFEFMSWPHVEQNEKLSNAAHFGEGRAKLIAIAAGLNATAMSFADALSKYGLSYP